MKVARLHGAGARLGEIFSDDLVTPNLNFWPRKAINPGTMGAVGSDLPEGGTPTSWLASRPAAQIPMRVIT